MLVRRGARFFEARRIDRPEQVMTTFGPVLGHAGQRVVTERRSWVSTVVGADEFALRFEVIR